MSPPGRLTGQASARSLEIVWWVFVLGVYLNVSGTLVGIFLPSVIVLFTLPLLFLFSYRTPLAISRRDLTFLVSITSLVFVMMIASPGKAYLGQKVLGFTQFVFALAVLVFFVEMSRKLDRNWLDRSLQIVLLCILVGSYLEVLGLLRGVSDAFRQVMYTSLYTADQRDLEMVGFIRPKLFTQEPSYVTGFYAIVAPAWLALNPRVGRFFVVAGLLSLLYIVTGSPKLILGMALALLVLMEARLAHGLKKKEVARVALMMAGVAFVGYFLMYDIFYERIVGTISEIDLTQMSSDNIRFVFPFITAIDVLNYSPWIGVGIGGKEVINQIKSLPVDIDFAIGNNGFARSLMFFGIVGSACFWVLLVHYVWKSNLRLKLSIIGAAGVIFLMGGGIEMIVAWGYLALFMSACLPSSPGNAGKKARVIGHINKGLQRQSIK